MDNTIQLYLDKEKEIKGYPITSPDRVVDENGVNIREQFNKSVKFKVVGEGTTVPPITGVYDDTEIRELVNEVNTSLDNMECYLTPEMFGAKGLTNLNNLTYAEDDTQAFKELISEAKRLKKSIRLSQNYYITEPLMIDFGINIIGNGSDRNIIITDKNISVLNFSNDVVKSGVHLSNFGIKGNGLPQQIALDLSYITNGSHIENLKISNVGTAIKIRKTWYTSFNNIRINSCNVTGIDICSIDSSNQVNNITFTSVNINQSEQCVTAENEQLASAVNFIGCSFESSTKTACKFVKFRGLSLIGCYFESNMSSETLLTYNNPIDLYIGGSGVNTTYSVIGCFFSRKNNFAESNNKVSIYCTANTNGVIQTNFFKCSTGSYIDYNIYSESSIPVEVIKNNQDGAAKKEYHGTYRRNILAFKEINLSSASNSTVYFSNNLNNTRMYVSFIPTIDFTSTTAPTLRIFDGSTNTTLQNISLGGVTEFIKGVEVEGVTNGTINTSSKLLKISTNQSSSGALTGYLTVYTIDNIIK